VTADPINAEQVAAAVLGKSKYRNVHPQLIMMLAERELAKGRVPREAVREVAGKLHQVAGAYFPRQPDYPRWLRELETTPRNAGHEHTRAFSARLMRSHASTAERIPDLEEFFHTTLESIAPVQSILDLACGLNPLALAWMPLRATGCYMGCDLYEDLIGFLNAFYAHIGKNGQFEACNLLAMDFPDWPARRAQVTFLLKTLPCLEQLEKGAGLRLLDAIPSPYILVSFPVSSLGGRPKGMRTNYENQFLEMVAGRDWRVKQFSFKTELAFLVEKDEQPV
jgi:16S rRNA (guanine(1405)-N(7))-methyltransferase